MFYWPFIFMTGFVLFSAFICNLSAVVMKPIHDFTEELSEQLEGTNIFFDKPIGFGGSPSHEQTNQDQDNRRTSDETLIQNEIER